MVPFSVYQKAAVRASVSLAAQWQIIPLSIVLYFALSAFTGVMAPLHMVGGVLISIAQIAALAVFFTWIEQCSRSQRAFQSFFQFDYGMFRLVLNAGFFVYLIQLAVSMLISGSNDLYWMGLAVQVLLLVALNALPEMAYIAKVDGVNVVQDTFEFMQRRWLEWLLPTILLAIPIVMMGQSTTLNVLASTIVMLPIEPIHRSLRMLNWGITGEVLTVIVSVWYMLFRKELFEQLIARGR